jgi:hypothetical protein
MKIGQEIPNLAKIGQTYRTLFMRTSIVADDIKSRENVSGCLDRPGGMNIARTLLYVIRALPIHESCLFLRPWLAVNIVRLSEGPNKADKNRWVWVFISSEENKTRT